MLNSSRPEFSNAQPPFTGSFSFIGTLSTSRRVDVRSLVVPDKHLSKRDRHIGFLEHKDLGSAGHF
ncbi:MAG TPA: hypothetical protein V6D35_07630 [Candidatus Sericytochromatia bacterium]